MTRTRRPGGLQVVKVLALIAVALGIGVHAAPAVGPDSPSRAGPRHEVRGEPAGGVLLTDRGSTWDLTSATLTQGRGTSYVVRADATDLTVIGGTVTGHLSRNVSWNELKGDDGSRANGAAYLVPREGSGGYVFTGSAARNVAVDMFRIAGEVSTVRFERVRAKDIRDDVFSLARRPDGGTRYVIRDSLVEGHTGISWRNTGRGANAPFRLEIDGLLLHLQPQSLRAGSCDEWASDGTGHGSAFKMDGFRGDRGLVTIRNTVIWVEEGNRDSCEHAWPAGAWKDVTVVWTGAGAFPGTLPAGVTLTTDRTLWDRVVAGWERRHGRPGAAGAW